MQCPMFLTKLQHPGLQLQLLATPKADLQAVSGPSP